ncbi:MAG: hypothetical protein FJX64_08800 [Alphaproteobacteria bacterium]|nr:hypothetical protein [Alphaproteobacteria bacterium]
MRRPTRREVLALTGAAALTGFLPPAKAQTLQQLQQRGILGAGGLPPARKLRIAMIVPARTGFSTVRTSINDYIGEGARMGAVLAEAILGDSIGDSGFQLELLHANAPIAEAAERAGTRLVETVPDVAAIVGGVGEGHAQVLGRIAERAGVPFFNIGDSTDALRGAGCGRYTFHVEASAAMFLDALVSLGASQGQRRWFVLHEDSDKGRALHARALKAVAKHSSGGQVVGAAAAERGQPVYYNEFNAIGRSSADVVLLLVEAVDQIAFLAQQENSQVNAPALAFPHDISQTRDYVASIRELAPLYNPRHRIAAWETTLTANGAAKFNEPYMARWSEPADPTAWASFHTIGIIAQAVAGAQSTAGPDLARYLERQDVTFDVGKGPGMNFRPWDHQLRQPLYSVNINQESEWVRIDFTTWVGLGKADKEIPSATPAGQAAQILDQFGDGPNDNPCRMPPV